MPLYVPPYYKIKTLDERSKPNPVRQDYNEAAMSNKRDGGKFGKSSDAGKSRLGFYIISAFAAIVVVGIIGYYATKPPSLSANNQAPPSPVAAKPIEQKHVYGHVTASVLSFRDAPNGNKIGSLENSNSVEILERRGDWIKIKTTDGRVGFVSSKHIAE